MSETLTCKTCGSSFKAGAFGGKCPRCMMGMASAGSRPGSFEVLPAGELDDALPEFEVHELVGRGGMGAVYRARQLDLDREVAIKLLAPDAGADPEFAERFSREAQVTAKLDHPGIVPVYGVGYDALGRCYYTMRMVRGRELGEIFRSWSLARSVAVIVRVCQAMAFAHGKGVVHRDLKPSNIMVGDLGEVYIMDWGLAKSAGASGERDIRLARGAGGDSPLMTMDGAVVGTPAYMPPEQAQSRVEEVDHLSDIYSLGALLYELLAGHPPYSPTGSQSTPAQVLQMLTVQPPAPLRQENARAPAELVAVCDKAMSRRQADRYPSAIALANDLQAWLDGRVVAAHGTGALVTARKWVARNRAIAALTGLGLCSVIIVQFLANRGVTSALEKEQIAKSEALATLAESHVSAGLQADTPAKAALFFDRAAAVAPDAEAQLTNRIRTKEWSRVATRIVRAFQVEGSTGALELHPAGRFLRVVTGDKPHLFDVVAEEPVELVPGATLVAAGWSTDGSVLAAATDAEAALFLYDLPALTVRAKLPASSGLRGPVVFSQDGSMVAVAAGMEECHVWSVRDGRLLCSSKAPAGSWCMPVCISPDGTRLVVQTGAEALAILPIGSDGGTVEPIGQPFACALLATFHTFHSAPEFLPRSSHFIHARRAAMSDTTFELVWRDAATGAELKSFPGFVHFGGLSPDGVTFAGRAGAFTGTFDTATGAPRVAMDFEFIIHHCRFSPDGARVIFSADAIATIPVFSTGDGKKLDDLAMQQRGARLTAFSADGTLAATAQTTGLIQVFSLTGPAPPPRRIISLDVTGRPANGQTAWPLLHPGGRLVALGGNSHRDSGIQNPCSRVLDIDTGEPAGPILDNGGGILSGAFTPDGETLALLATAGALDRSKSQFLPDGQAGNLQLWDWKKGSRHGDPIPMPSEPRCIVFRAGEAHVWCGGGQVVEVDLATRGVTPLFQTKEWEPNYYTNYGRIAYSPDGGALFAWQQGEKVIGWDLAAGRERFPPVIIGNACADLAFLPGEKDGSGPAVFATVEFFSDPSDIRFFDVLSGQPLARRIPLGSYSSQCLPGPDGSRLLVTATQAYSVRLYDWRSGTAICPEVRHASPAYSAAFVPGTRWCASGDSDGTLQLWDGDTGKLIAPSLEIPLKYYGIYDIKATPDGRHLLYSPHASGEFHIFDVAALRNDFPLSPAGQQLLCEINAAAIAHPNGGTVPLDAEEWYQRWVKLRTLSPGFHDMTARKK